MNQVGKNAITAFRYYEKRLQVAGTPDVLARDIQALSFKEFNQKYGTGFRDNYTFECKIRQTYNYLKKSSIEEHSRVARILEGAYQARKQPPPPPLEWLQVMKYFVPWRYLTTPEKIESAPSGRAYVGVYVDEEKDVEEVLGELLAVAAATGTDPFFPLLDAICRYFEQFEYYLKTFEPTRQLQVAFDACLYTIDEDTGETSENRTFRLKFYPDSTLLFNFLRKVMDQEASKDYPGRVVIRYIKPVIPIVSRLLTTREVGKRVGIYVNFR